MKFISKAIPEVSKGFATKGGKITVPDQSMSLQEILTRFTRKEKLPIGFDIQYHNVDYDLEKVARLDLTERDEFLEFQRSVKRRYEAQQAQKRAQQKAAEEAAKAAQPPSA